MRSGEADVNRHLGTPLPTHALDQLHYRMFVTYDSPLPSGLFRLQSMQGLQRYRISCVSMHSWLRRYRISCVSTHSWLRMGHTSS